MDIRFAAAAGAREIRVKDTGQPGLRVAAGGDVVKLGAAILRAPPWVPPFVISWPASAISRMMAQMPPAERGAPRRSTVMEALRAGLHRAPDQFTDQIGIPEADRRSVARPSGSVFGQTS